VVADFREDDPDVDEEDDFYDLDDDDLPVLAGDEVGSLGGFGGLLGGQDLGGLLGRAQQAMAEAQEAAFEVVEGSAGNGAVRVIVNGAFEFSKVTIAPDVVDRDDIEMLEDLVLAALNDAAAKIRQRQEQIQQQMMGGLGGLGNLFGGA
jgi:DNA-binding YbaB/EbfC family protein